MRAWELMFDTCREVDVECEDVLPLMCRVAGYTVQYVLTSLLARFTVITMYVVATLLSRI